MWILHVPFSFEIDLPYRGFDAKASFGTEAEKRDPFRRWYGETQFACAGLQPVGAERNGFPMGDRLEDFGKVLFVEYNRKECGRTPENPVTPALLAERIHGFAREYCKLWPLVAVHAVRLSRWESMANAVTYISCAVPLLVVHGQITYDQRKRADS